MITDRLECFVVELRMPRPDHCFNPVGPVSKPFPPQGYRLCIGLVEHRRDIGHEIGGGVAERLRDIVRMAAGVWQRSWATPDVNNDGLAKSTIGHSLMLSDTLAHAASCAVVSRTVGGLLIDTSMRGVDRL